MHFAAFVLIPPDGDPREAVERIMAPYCEHDAELDSRSTFWDWYVIGGRWDGELIPGNIANAADVSREVRPFAIITDGGAHFADHYECDGDDKYSGKLVEHPDWPGFVRGQLDGHTGRVVVVDYHS